MSSSVSNHIPHTIKAFCDATILTGEAMVEQHALLVRGDSIVDIVGNRHIPADAKKIPCPGQILAPGLIDAQVNGGGNRLLNNDPTVETCLAIAKAHRNYGTTGLLLTCISDTPEISAKALASIREAQKQDQTILGAHMEGPHLAEEKRGVHCSGALRPLSDADIAFYQPVGDEIMLLTVAPEAVTSADVQKLSQKCIISLGHSNALSRQIKVLLENGATGFTHLYNGMSGMSAREPGVAGTALDDRHSWCSLIADGHHVAPEMVRLALRAKPQGKVFLVSDAMAPAAAPQPGPFQLYGQPIKVENGCCVSAEGKLAGSAITLLDAVRYCIQEVGIEFDEALRMAATYPAAFLRIGHKFGKLLPNYAANIVALTPSLDLRAVWSVGYT